MLIGITGSIGLLAMPMYLNAFRLFVAREIDLIVTRSAERMIPRSTWAILGNSVTCESDPPAPEHVSLPAGADLFLVAPATANVLGAAAHGLGPSVLTSAVLASPGPVVFVPNMNRVMWEKPAVQRNIRVLREDGHQVVEPNHGFAFEVATRRFERHYTLPAPEELTSTLRAIIAERGDGSRRNAHMG
ncbi:flavoprotein [Actinomadura terrae]|uniref:flavoprotein n=1 Tax=Actinomadura terrae TaxID=604353 RepID=UPI001FA6E884|nr:flavoprotein [Actinomadura terrae]